MHSHFNSGCSLFDAVRCSIVGRIGAYAIAVAAETYPTRTVVARRGAPLLLGLGDGANFTAPDASALLQVTQRTIYLEEGDCAEVSLAGVRIVDAYHAALEKGADFDKPRNLAKSVTVE